MIAVPRLFLRLFLLLALLVIGGTGWYGSQEIDAELAKLRSRETASVKLGAGALSGKIQSITQDLMFLSRQYALNNALRQPTPANIALLTENFATFSGAKGIYDQIRWLDETGMERVRVDYVQGKPVVVAADRLQNKAKRYYFSDAVKLDTGEVFISPLDLNIEQNKIEVPYKPMIRLATPVADREGGKRGIVILNYYGGEMLQAFARASPDNADHGMVVNAGGYWLKSPVAADEWGFMFKRPDLSLAARAPEAWRRIVGADAGQLELEDGLWTWETVYPLLAGQRTSTGTAEAFGPSHREIESRQYYWKAVSHYSAARLSALRQAVWLKLALAAGLLLGLVALGSWKLTRAWSQLAAAEEKYQTVADFAYDWETWIDPAGHCNYCSPSCLRITGRSAAAFMDDPGLLVEIAHPDDRARLEEHLRRHLESEGAGELVVRILLPDGRVRWLEHACRPVFGPTGRYLGRRASNRDITERKQAEEELERYRLHLEDRVAERTRELGLAKAAAEAASRAKSTFLANMSHELRTPMNAIMGLAGLAMRRAEDPKLIDQLGKIDRASQHLLSVINNILDLSKIEADRLKLEQVGFRPGEVMENIRSLIGHKTAEKGLRFVVDMPADVAGLSVRGDPLRLSQILLNLAGNAVKFTGAGVIGVRARVVEDGPADVLLRFEVEDTGIGIAAEDQARLFTAFEQADGSLTRKYGGTGLGLAISKRLVGMMGGGIGVTSEVGRGSTFWFTVRLAKSAPVAVATETAGTTPAEARLKTRYAGARILLAEDEPINQEVSRDLLEGVGLRVDLAEDGVKAVAMAQDTPYDLILMDMQMPRLNGIEATRAIRAIPGRERTPILAMTANAFDEDRQRCLDAGMNDHIGKPVDPDRLYDTLLKWLSGGAEAQRRG